MVADASAAVVETTERYYDSVDADRFYEKVWGGEDIHIGLYDSPAVPGPEDDAKQTIGAAGRNTVETMAERLGTLGAGSRVVDLGSGYGGSARYVARRFGCQVTCINLSERQNQRNEKLTRAAGLGDRVEIRHGNFEDLPLSDASCDVVWSQDAFLHSGRRRRVLEEAARVLAPGGQLIFTDPMQADDCPPGVLGDVYARIHLDSMGSFAFYRETAGEVGLDEVRCEPLTHHLRTHYARVRAELERQRPALRELVSEAYIDRMLAGLSSWVHAADEGWLAWGILQFRRI